MKRLLDSSAAAMDRRQFVKLSALAGGGLLVSTYVHLGALDAESGAAAADFTPNAFIRITPSGAISIIAPNSEMGQGVKTSLPMIVAEELDVAWEQVTITQGDLNPEYGRQMSVGSQSTPTNYAPLRRAGATARAVLVQAAAETWSVPASECTTESGAVVHRASNRRATYGELATKAASITPPANVQTKDPRTFKLLGTRVPGVDNPKIVTGAPLFGIDVQLPGMLYATYTKCPAFGGKVVSANLDAVKARPGVRDAFVLDGIEGLPSGVAIVADSTWNAFSATKALQVKWEEGAVVSQNSTDMAKTADQLAAGTPAPPAPEGAKVLKATYHYPFLAHATLEPQNCTAVYKNGVMEMWAPSQIPSVGQGLVSRGLGIEPGKITVHITRLGGGFGRRGSNEFSIEVAAIAKKLEGTPVKLMWPREYDFAHDNYRSNGWHYFTAGIDSGGKVVSLHDAFVKMQGGPGDMNAAGFPFIAVPGSSVNSSKLPGGIPTGYWRAPGDNGNVWATQCFVDELAHAAGREPLAFTIDLINSPSVQPGFGARRMLQVLKLATDKAGWGQQLPRGEGQGFAITRTMGAWVAVVADVAVSRDG
ncbi:MAG TPA: molybdopterin cofactor-binding domain-containing protein, partial [Gemmatimonadaceae bacterium]|nr:molybdopterin cofactor-binding domain-containing protein [Gemmatimonadaceae bacterium]